MNNNTGTFLHSHFWGHSHFVDKVVHFHLWMLNNVNFVRNSSSSWWLITSNHNNFDTSRSALGYGQINISSWRIVQGDNTNKGEIVHWESSWLISVISRRKFWVKTPVLPCLNIKLIIFSVFIGWEVVFSKGKDSLSKSSEVRVSFVNFISKFFSEIYFLTVDENL